MSRKPQDHYEMLGVHPDAPAEVIQAARAALVSKYVVVEGGEQKLRRINAAFDVLGNPERRAAYDELTRGPAEDDDAEESIPAGVKPSATARTTDAAPAATMDASKTQPGATPTRRVAFSTTKDGAKSTPATSVDPTSGWRIGRLTLWSLHLFAVVTAVVALAAGWWAVQEAWVFAVAMVPVNMLSVRARLRDLGRDPDDWWLGLIPIYNLIFAWPLAFYRGLPSKRTGSEECIGVTCLGIALAGVVTGVYSNSQTNERLAQVRRQDQQEAAAYASATAAPAPTPPRALRKLTAIEWQRCLIANGYKLGPSGADGQWGPASQAAFDAFARAHPDNVMSDAEIRTCWGE